MNQGEIVWVKLPFSDLSRSKVRPALVVSNNNYNQSSSDVVVCAITSNLNKIPYSVLIENKDLSSGSLPLKSKVRADKLQQIEKALVIKPLASLSDKTFDKVTAEIRSLVKKSGKKQA